MVALFCLAFLPALARTRSKSMQMRCVANLKEIGSVFLLYAQAHQDTLPGPVSCVPQAGYDETSRQELAWYIAEDLGFPGPSTNTVVLTDLLCPAYRLPSLSHCQATARTYVLNENVSSQRGNRIPPFGSVVQPLSPPLKLSSLSTYGPPFRMPAMTDADKVTVNPTLSSWKDLPYRPSHGKARSRLFFDGHVEVNSW